MPHAGSVERVHGGRNGASARKSGLCCATAAWAAGTPVPMGGGPRPGGGDCERPPIPPSAPSDSQGQPRARRASMGPNRATTATNTCSDCEQRVPGPEKSSKAMNRGGSDERASSAWGTGAEERRGFVRASSRDQPLVKWTADSRTLILLLLPPPKGNQSSYVNIISGG